MNNSLFNKKDLKEVINMQYFDNEVYKSKILRPYLNNIA